MPWGTAGHKLSLFARGRIGIDFPAEERVSQQVAAVLDRIEGPAVESFLTRLAERGGVPGWVPAAPLTLHCEVERARPEDESRSRRLDLVWLHDHRIVFAIEVKVRQLSWILGGQDADKLCSYATGIARESGSGARLLALTPYSLPRSEIASAKRELPTGSIVWAAFCDTLREISALGAATPEGDSRSRWPVAATLLPELALLLGDDGLNLDFPLVEADMDALQAYSGAIENVLRVLAATESFGGRLEAELSDVGLLRDKDSDPDEITTRLRFPYWVFDPAEPDASAEDFLVAVGLDLDALSVVGFFGFCNAPHSAGATAALAAGQLPLAWWGEGEERPRLGVAAPEWAGLVAEAGSGDWWGTASSESLVDLLPHGLTGDASVRLARWVKAELQRIGPAVTQADVWPVLSPWPAAWRVGQLANHAAFDPCPTCPASTDLHARCPGESGLGWGPVPCQAVLVREFTDDTGKLRLVLPRAGEQWRGAPRSDGMYARDTKPYCCGEALPELGRKRSLTCPTCGRRHERAAIQGIA